MTRSSIAGPIDKPSNFFPFSHPPAASTRTTTAMGSIVLPHLQTAWHVDQAILSEEERLVVIRFGRDHDPDCEYRS